MNCRFKLSKEFFGGVLYDTKTKKNISIDQDLYSFIKSLIYCKTDTVRINNDEVMEILNQLFSIGVFSFNVDLLESTNQEYEDHLNAPFRVFYDITYECNLCCKHCFTNSGAKRKDELSLDEKLYLVSEIKKLGTNRISIAGGEPFICSDLFPFLHSCKDSDIDVSVTTNGTLFTPSIIVQANECNLKNLTVSFDGGTKKSMDSIRGEGVYERVIDGLRLLSEHYKYGYSIKTTLMKNNIHEIENIIETAIEHRCKTIKFNCVREDGRAVQNKELTILNDKEYVEVIERIEKVKNKYQDKIQIKAPLNIFCDDDYDYIEDLGFGCFAGKESLCIDPTGNIKPCSHFPKEFVCGNIKDNSLVDVWHNSKILYDFRHLSGNDDCNECEHYDMCRAGCRYRAYLSGNINSIDPFCYIEKRSIKN